MSEHTSPKSEMTGWSDPAIQKTELYREAKVSADRLLAFLKKSPTAWQAIEIAKQQLDANGFVPFPGQKTKWEEGDCGYIEQNGSALIAFRIGTGGVREGFKIFGTHSDSPALKIKPNAISKSEGVFRLTTEVYGGPLLSTWFDRPLSLAGRVVLKGESALQPVVKLIDLKKPILILPNVAIHMNREANNGVKIERHRVLLPFLCTGGEETDPNLLERLISDELNCDTKDILDFELYTYEVNPPSYCGLNDCFISAGRLDNLAMTEVGLAALMEANGKGIQVLLVTDNEEVGSMTKQGADGLFARDALERITLATGAGREDFLNSFARSFMISGDLAHAVHPNYAEYADPDHRPRINGGPVIKVAASQSYASDSVSASVFRNLAEEAGVPCQTFVNRSDLRGGSTIGPISSSLLPLSTVDIGNPVWGMHSIRETGGLLDHLYLEKVLKHFFSL